MRILIDLDGVLYHLSPVWLKYYNAQYNDTLTLDDITTWDFHKHVKPGCGKKIYDFLNDPTIYHIGNVIPGSQDTTQRWIDKGHELAIVTAAATDIAATEKLLWCKHYFPWIKNVVITRGHIKHWLEADFMIDDGIHNLMQFKGLGLLYTQHHNKSINSTELDIPRVNDWKEVELYVNTYEWFRGIV